MKAINFPALIQRFFTDRLRTQMEASSNTVAGYRDTFRLLIASAVPLWRFLTFTIKGPRYSDGPIFLTCLGDG